METEPKADPVIQFVLAGLTYSLSQNRLTEEQAKEAIANWYPEAEILEG